ncbi:MAG: hypothetical protein ACYC0V_14345 [Armatimonadota bacterium]
MQRMNRIVDFIIAMIIIAIVAGLYVRLKSKGEEHVIATGNAPGVKVELLSIRHVRSDTIQVRLRKIISADLASKYDYDKLSLTQPHIDFPSHMVSEISDDKRVYNNVATFYVPLNTRNVSIAYKIITKRPKDRASFDFINVTPRMLPILRKIGDTRVTLKSLNINKEVSEGWKPWMYTSDSFKLSQKYFGVVVDIQSEGWAPELHTAKFTDAEGPHKLVAECLHPSAIRVQANPMSEAMWVGNGRRMYLYEPLSESPKKFNFCLTLKVPPDKADQRVVEFKDVAVR